MDVMACKSLLLDIDGVIVRDKLLLEHVKDNCVSYVQTKLPHCKDPRMTNNLLYLAHGHTAKGLTKVFGIDASDFNEKVYDKRLMDHLAEVIYGTDFQQEAKEVYELLDRGWYVTLFTNSPKEWASAVAQAIGNEINFVCPGELKPAAGAYTHFPKHHTHMFVDDSLKNLGTARWLPNWHPILFTENQRDPRSWCPQVQSIWEMCLYINSVDQWIKDHH
jgi:hypothetical protein